jgi:hypothetical protein
MCLPDAIKPANIEHIIATANAAQPRLTKLVVGALAGEKACDGSRLRNSR